MTKEYIDSVQLTAKAKATDLDAGELERLRLDFNKLLEVLEASDLLMYEIILRAQSKPFQLPDDPKATVEYGLMLYWIQNPPDLLKDIIKELGIPGWAWDILKAFAPTPKVTTEEYDFLWTQIDEHNGVVAPDGTILGKSQYEQLDLKWLYAFGNYLLNLIHPGGIAPFGTNPFCEEMESGKDGTVRIMVIGDWGTGLFDKGDNYDPVKDILEMVPVLKPDYLIHLGDVYYAGTEDRLPPGEEQKNFLSLWPKMPKKHSFTLNSNHEMYGGANGYFNIALGVKPAKTTPFSHQNGTSYFALTFGDWAIVGLDAAYHDPSSLYMLGGLGEESSYPDQYELLRKATANARKVMLLSHQTAMNTEGNTPLPLWHDVENIVQPDYWYWGHIHLGIVYSEQSCIGKSGVKARCVGHSAVPFGKAWGLENNDNISWYADTLVGVAGKDNLVKNGFALLTLGKDGSIKEEFYETGNKNPVWTS